MARRRNNFLLFVFLCFAWGLTAQNTGYMGKRVIVNMGAELSPAWRRPVSEKLTFDSKYLSFNAILSPNIEIIAHKTGTVGLVYHYLNTRYNTPFKEDGYFEFISLDSIYEKPDIVEKLTAHGFGIYYKQYMRFADGRSPMGAYIKLQFDGFFFQCPTFYYDRSIMMSDQLFAMKIEIGNDFLLFNRLRLSTGFALGVPFSGYKGLSHDNEFLRVFYSTKPLNEYARSRIWGAYWLGFTVGIGFLAF